MWDNVEFVWAAELQLPLPTIRRFSHIAVGHSKMCLARSMLQTGKIHALPLRLHRTCVLSSLSWGAPLWAPYAVSYLARSGVASHFEHVHHSFLLWFLRGRHTCPLKLFYHKTGSLPHFPWFWLVTLRCFVRLRSLRLTTSAAQAFWVDLQLAAASYSTWCHIHSHRRPPEKE